MGFSYSKINHQDFLKVKYLPKNSNSCPFEELNLEGIGIGWIKKHFVFSDESIKGKLRELGITEPIPFQCWTTKPLGWDYGLEIYALLPDGSLFQFRYELGQSYAYNCSDHNIPVLDWLFSDGILEPPYKYQYLYLKKKVSSL